MTPVRACDFKGVEDRSNKFVTGMMVARCADMFVDVKFSVCPSSVTRTSCKYLERSVAVRSSEVRKSSPLPDFRSGHTSSLEKAKR